jgi:N-hydroxyarylamine O-acetyltransferase
LTFAPEALAAYWRRVGIDAPTTTDRGALAAIVAAHTATIPFDGLDPLLGLPVELSPEALIAKLVTGGRGGYCFEQNLLLKGVLETLGFAVTGLTARVQWLAPPGTITLRTHMLLRVDLAAGPVIVDAGFGGNVLTGVLDLVEDVEQATPHEPFRLVRDGASWIQQVRIDGNWKPTYGFTLDPQFDLDYQLPNWFMSTSPRSHFVSGLTCARALPDRRLALRNFDYAIHHLGGTTERRHLGSAEEICDVIEQDFGIHLPDQAVLKQRIEAGLL